MLRPGLLAGAGITLSGAVPDAVGARLRALGAGEGTDVLVHAAARPRDADGVRAALDEAWDAIRATMLPPGPGLIVLLAPAPGGAHRAAARAGLENMARTLSIEWAQHDIRVTAVQPGAATPPEQVANLVAYLASPGGDYFSGCAFSMG